MKYMLKYIYILFFVFFSIVSLAQSEYYEDEFPYLNNEYNSGKSPMRSKKSQFLSEDNFNFRFSTGTSYMNFYGNNLFSSYMMPEVKYKFNDRFSISAGVIASLNYFPNFTFPNQETSLITDSKMYSYYIFAKGEYLVNDRIRLRGTTIFNPGSEFAYDRFSFNNIGIDIKIAEKAYFSADFSVTKTHQAYPWVMSPFGGYFDGFHTRPWGNTMSVDHFSQW